MISAVVDFIRHICNFITFIRRKLLKHPMMRDTGMCVLLSLLWFMLNTLRHSATQEEPLLVISGKAPTRFFGRGSPVRDYYRGEINGLAHSVQTNDVTFAFFYASWCIASASMKPVFEDAAHTYKDQASFLAVNCALHGSPCATKRRPDNFPLVGAFVRRQRSMFVPYRGYPSEEHFTVFVQRVLRPFVRIDSEKDYASFVEENDLAIVASVDLNEPRGLNVLWNTSLLIIRHDPRHEVKFGVITNSRLFRHLGYAVAHHLRIVLVGEIKQCPKEVGINLHDMVTRSVLISGIPWHRLTCFFQLQQTLRNFHNLHETTIENAILPYMTKTPVRWLFPMFHRSTALAEITRNATLLAFIPYCASHHCSPAYELIRKTVILYNDCKGNIDVASMSDDPERDAYNRCKANRIRCQAIRTQFAEINVKRGRLRRSNCVCIGNSSYLSEDFCWMRNFVGSSSDLQNSTLIPSVQCDGRYRCSSGIVQWRKYSACCYSKQIRSEFDVNIPLMQLDACRNIEECRDACGMDPRLLGDTTKISAIQGLRCKSNRTLDVIAMDSMTYPDFLKNFGLTLGMNNSRLVIVDKPRSEKYVYPASVSLTFPGLADFVVNYTRDTLDRNRRSVVITDKSPQSDSRDFIRIEEISGGNFSSVFDLEEDVVMLYYASWCTFCKAVMSIYYSVAAKFSGIRTIRFSRIDIQKNELPWEYRITEVPSFQIFSGKRKRDNIATLPRDILITPVTLLKFILLHVDAPVWRSFVSDRCDYKCWNTNRAQAAKLYRISQKQLKLLRSVRLNTHHKEALTWKIISWKRKRRLLLLILSTEEAHTFFRKFIWNVTENMSSTFVFRSLMSSRFLF